jgi:K+-sensing histidine kinase KdpD
VLVLETIRGPAIFAEADMPFLQTIADLIALAIDRDRLAAQADAIREERRAERMRSEVLATLSHELRMPLTAIQGYSSALLLDEVDWSDEKRQEFLRLIEDECNSMQTMLKDILDSSLIDVDQLIIERQPARIPVIAREIAEEFQRRTESHRIMVDFAATFPILEIDTRWIKQVFRNILDNALKYSPEGGLIVIRGEARPGDVMIVIADQGIGISPENLIPLFERYYRVRSTANLHIPGTGLGLPIARAIVEAHGGRIWAESKLGEGTTIYFSLPNRLGIE